jgi:hypothetical protein
LQFDAVSQAVTLVNTEENADEQRTDHFLEVDEALFVTAHQQFTIETTDSQPLPSDQRVVDGGEV